MSDTPETDKMRGYDPSWNGMLPYAFACRLERQRDAYAETLRNIAWWDLPIADTIRERHPELAQEATETP